MVLTNYVTQILFSLMIGHIFIFISRAGASADRVQEVLQEEIDIANPLHPDTKPIEDGEVVFENVSFSYAGQKGEPVLRNISFSVRSGEMVTIVGTTGSGKSTLMYLIPRFYDVTEGRVLIDGEDVRKKDLKTLRAAIGMVLQEPVLFLGTIRENICWGRPDASFEEVVEAARVAQAHDFIMTFPEGYDTPLGQRGVNLSGGQKQRIAIARVIVKNPAVLILDDSTSAVDVVTEQLILEGLKKRSKKCTTFLITQRTYTVMSADKILVLDKGKPVAQGTHRKLLEKEGFYHHLYMSQFGFDASPSTF